MSLAQVKKIADAVLYEGYVLYPYRASALKNRYRWQFGVVAPLGYMQTECLVEPASGAALDVQVRFLQIQARTLENGHTDALWEEGVVREIDICDICLPELIATERSVPFEVPPGQGAHLIQGLVRMSAVESGGFIKVRVRIENLTRWEADPPADRTAAIRKSLVGAHTLLAARGGAFVSLLDPPPSAVELAVSCQNLHTWPVLVGQPGSRDLMLSSPIILYDYPAVAPESTGDLCDATEIDELLTLRVMTLTEDEKREARGTDSRARQIIDRADAATPEMLCKLHGAIRNVPKPVQELMVRGRRVAQGCSVRLHPQRRSDSMDMFLEDRLARVEGVFHDLDGSAYVAVTLEDDPGADLHRWYGRFFYFYPEEIEPLEVRP